MIKILVLCTTDSMIWNFLGPHIAELEKMNYKVECACSRTGFFLDDLITSSGLTIHEIPFTRNPVSAVNIKGFRSLKKLIGDKQYDYIYCHEPVGGLMGRLAAKVCHKKAIYMVHGFHFFSGATLKHWLFFYTAEWMLSFFTEACITINREDYIRALKMHAKRKYLVHGIGVQLDRLRTSISRTELRNMLDISLDDFLLITVGELSTRKNQRLIIEALHKINCSRIKLLICGEGALQADLEELTKSYGLEHTILFTGFVRNVGDFYSAADLFVFPSLWEGLAIAGLEAMACGLPILGSNRRGIKDYIEEDVNGFLFEPDDALQLANLIIKMENDRNLCVKLGKAAQCTAQQYSVQASLDELREIYQKEFL